MFTLAKNVVDKNLALDEQEVVQQYFAGKPLHRALMATLTPECEYVFKVMIALGQEHLFEKCDVTGMRKVIEQLVQVEGYYADIGGIYGLQEKVEELLSGETPSDFEYCPPPMIDLRAESAERTRAIEVGLASLPLMAEIYPIGGAADRLKNRDEKTGKELPAVPFTFLGRSLLEGLIRDLQGREYLYAQKFGKKIETPIVLMTSEVKGNHDIVLDLLRENNYFGRDRDNFFVIKQPLVPSFDREGRWALSEEGTLDMKPGGHGALWKLMREKEAFKWLHSRERTKAIVRQINNPIAGTDFLLLALVGIGIEREADFGFASCERLVGASEGVNILQVENGEGAISNIEYCDFEKYGIEDVPREAGGPYSLFPSNTNILFADLKAVEEASKRVPYPGALLNFKGEITRLETTMQNIAVELLERVDSLSTFLIFNERKKTISTAKRERSPGGAIEETSDGALFDYLSNNCDLLRRCGFSVPDLTKENFLLDKPEIRFQFHPALGPLYSTIQKKLRGGSIAPGSLLILEIADVEIENLDLDGTLEIVSEDLSARADLKNIKIKNGAHLTIHLAKGKTLSFQNKTFTSSQIIKA